MKKNLLPIAFCIYSMLAYGQNVKNSELLFFRKLTYLNKEKLQNDSVHIGDRTAQTEKEFIEREFDVNFKADNTLYTGFGNFCDSCSVQFGLLSFSFSDPNEFQKLKIAIDKKRTINFQIPVLNLYKVYYSNTEVLFIYTYRPMNSLIRRLVLNDTGIR